MGNLNYKEVTDSTRKTEMANSAAGSGMPRRQQ